MTIELKVSVVTPNFNGEAMLARTMDSVFAQDYSNFEYIVVDGGSTDRSPEILEGYRERLSKLIIERDRGQYDAINKGFSHATGDIFCWLNSDDVYFPWTLHVVNRIFRDFPEIDWITGIRSELRDGAVQGMSNLTPFPRELLEGGAFFPGGLGCVMQECCFWRRSLFEKVGGLDLRWSIAGDFELWTRFARHADLVATTALLGGFNYTDANRSFKGADLYSEEVRQVRSALPQEAVRNGDALIRRKNAAERFFFKRPWSRRFLHSWFYQTSWRGPVLGFDAGADRYVKFHPVYSIT